MLDCSNLIISDDKNSLCCLFFFVQMWLTHRYGTVYRHSIPLAIIRVCFFFSLQMLDLSYLPQLKLSCRLNYANSVRSKSLSEPFTDREQSVGITDVKICYVCSNYTSAGNLSVSHILHSSSRLDPHRLTKLITHCHFLRKQWLFYVAPVDGSVTPTDFKMALSWSHPP